MRRAWPRQVSVRSLRQLLENLRARRPAALAGIALLVGLAVVAGVVIGGRGDDGAKLPEASGGGQRPSSRASFLARLIPPPPDRTASPARGRPVPRSATELARRLPLERKVAQLFLLGFSGTDLNAGIYVRLRRLDLGGVVIGKGNYTDPQQLAAMAGEAGVIARQVKHVPPWVMADQEGGEFNSFADLPPATAAADLGDTGAAVAEATESATNLKTLGINGVLGPVLDVGAADDPAVGARAFSDDPAEVSSYARAVVVAYRRARVFAAVEHFPGLGSGAQPTEEGPSNVGLSVQELRGRDLRPFRAAVGAGAPGVVLSSGLYATDDFVTPGALSHSVATGLLRRGVRFRGIAITDDLADPAITALGSVPDAAVKAMRAGADMLYISGPPGDQQAAYVAVLRAVKSGEIPRRRLNEAVSRVLSIKRDYGLIAR